MSDRPCLVCEGWGAYCDKHKPRTASPSGPREALSGEAASPAAAAARSAGLDIERLGRAVRACRYRFDVNERSNELAEAIAAEYDRLSRSGGEAR